MKKFVIATVLVLCSFNMGYSQRIIHKTQKDRLEEHVYYLASDKMKGREAGSDEAMNAAIYMQEQFQRIGLESYYEEWMQSFTQNDIEYHNVVAFIEGNDPRLRNEYIVVGAHFDHIGTNKKGEVFNGADDNASGSAALIEVARHLQANKKRLGRSIIIAAFDGEEQGLIGSTQLCKKLMAERIDIKLMISIDMVGWYRVNRYLELEGVGTLKTGKDLTSRGAQELGLNIRTKDFESSLLTATDTEPFAKNQIPTLFATTGTKSPYHEPEDDADLIDYEGLDKITSYLGLLVGEAACDPILDPSGKFASKHKKRTPRTRGLVKSIGGGYGSSYIDFKDAAFVGKTSDSYNIGIGMDYYIFSSLAIGTGVEYVWQNALYPDPDDYLNKSELFRQQGVLVPLNLTLGGDFLYLKGGIYYFKNLKSARFDFDNNPNQIGYSLGYGVSLGPFAFEFRHLYGFTNLLIDTNEISAPATKLSTNEFKIKLNF